MTRLAILGMCVVLGAAMVTEMGGLSMAMGAFLAGVVLSESTFRHQLEADVEPFRGILLGLFFLGVGMALDLRIIAANVGLILVSVTAFVKLKMVAIYGVARLFRAAAESERVHAANHLLALQRVETTVVNLDAAIENEAFQFEELYPAYMDIARNQREEAALEAMHRAMAVERIHEVLFGRAKEAVKDGRDLAITAIWVCPVEAIMPFSGVSR